MPISWPTAVNRLAEGALHLVWPPQCVNCGTPTRVEHFCPGCVAALTTDQPHHCRRCSGNVGPHADPAAACPRCEKWSYAFASAVRFGLYGGVLRDAVLRLKQPDGELLAFRLGELWATHRRSELLAASPQVVVPVPLHWRRRWSRGYNQAEEVARGLAKSLGLPLAASALSRRRATELQSEKSATARWDNVRDVFVASRPGDVRGLRVLLVDDVLTTGATCHYAALALSRVWGGASYRRRPRSPMTDVPPAGGQGRVAVVRVSSAGRDSPRAPLDWPVRKVSIDRRRPADTVTVEYSASAGQGSVPGVHTRGFGIMRRTIFTGLILLCAAGQGIAAGAEMFPETAKDFGTSPRGPVLTHYFPVKNTTDQPITLGQPRVSCGCVSASVLKSVLAPGESTSVVAMMDTKRIPQANTTKTVIVFVTVQAAGRVEEVQLRVTSVARDDLVMAPDNFAFGTVRAGQGGKVTTKLTLYSDPTWQIKEAESSGIYVKATVKKLDKLVNEAGTSYEVTATLDPACPVGNWTADVYVKTSAAGMEKLRIPVTVNVIASIAVNPDPVAFGAVVAGTASEQKVVLTGSQAFKIVEVKGADSGTRSRPGRPGPAARAHPQADAHRQGPRGRVEDHRSRHRPPRPEEHQNHRHRQGDEEGVVVHLSGGCGPGE